MSERMTISKEIGIDMGHRVPNHKSKCCNPHGHRYKFEVGVNGELIKKEGDSSEGMVIDFGDLKQVMMEVIDGELDHGFMVYENDTLLIDFFKTLQDDNYKVIIVDFIPTVENIAKYVYEKMKEKLEAFSIELEYIKVWETPTSVATYKE